MEWADRLATYIGTATGLLALWCKSEIRPARTSTIRSEQRGRDAHNIPAPLGQPSTLEGNAMNTPAILAVGGLAAMAGGIGLMAVNGRSALEIGAWTTVWAALVIGNGYLARRRHRA